MLVQTCWLLSLVFVVSTNALVSTSSAHHTSSSTIKKTTVPTSSTHHTSTSSSTKRTTVSPSSSHHTSSSSTKSSTTPPTSTPSTFYLVAANTGQTSLDGSYMNTILDPYPADTDSGDLALHFGGKTSKGAANFTLTADGYLRCNCASGPLYACVSNGHPVTQIMELSVFDNLAFENMYGMVPVTCQIAAKVLTCQWYSLVVWYFDDIDGGFVDIGPVGDANFTLQVVPT